MFDSGSLGVIFALGEICHKDGSDLLLHSVCTIFYEEFWFGKCQGDRNPSLLTEIAGSTRILLQTPMQTKLRTKNLQAD